MKSLKTGKNTSKSEVTSISKFGFWIFFKEKEYFLDYDYFPWFKKASVEQISNIESVYGDNFHWPDLDIDLNLKIITKPEAYPLKSMVNK